MIQLQKGNLLESSAEALVNTVNTVGVMGKGVALQFKEKFPENFLLYAAACKRKEVLIGEMFVTQTGRMQNPKYIINFPTKQHWRSDSKLSFVEDGLDDLVQKIADLNIQSIALPPLGCGNGGLDWAVIKPLIISKLAHLNITIEVYEPGLKISSTTPKIGTSTLTKARAMVLRLLDNYAVLGFESTHLEVQKLAYFLQSFGQADLKLRYQKGTYGPYAPNLQHLLSRLEGQWLAGDVRVADGRPFDPLWLMPGKTDEIEQAIQRYCSPEERIRLEQVNALIEGFQSPFGLELLATVHWASTQETGQVNDLQSVVAAVHQWNARKQQLMNADLIATAYERVREFVA